MHKYIYTVLYRHVAMVSVSPDMALGFYRAAQIEFIAPPPYCWQITGRRF